MVVGILSGILYVSIVGSSVRIDHALTGADNTYINPSLPSAATLGRHRRRWVLSSAIAPVRPCVHPERR